MGNNQKLIVAAGSIRSGSTWLYNAIRLILLARNRTVIGCWIDDLAKQEIGSYDFVLVKTHEPNEFLRNQAWRVFTSHRDLRDVARSSRDFLGIDTQEDLTAYVSAPIAHHDYWVKYADYDMKYEQMIMDAGFVVQHIAEKLSIKISKDQEKDIVQQLANLPEPNNADSYDKSTLLHPRHRFEGAVGGWVGSLTECQVEAINNKFGWWMEKYGYLKQK
jgi:hypothetical protein